jgi:hypothetical protein
MEYRNLTVKRPTEDLAHLAWCIMVAVKLAQEQGKAATELQVHLFIMQWLATAQKRKLFPRSVAPDILWLINQGKRYGFAAKLNRKVEYIWRSTTGELAKQSVLFRFTWFVETLKTMGWCGLLQSTRDWCNGRAGSATTRTLCIPEAELHPAFSEDGALIKPLELRVTGDISDVFPLLEQSHLSAEQRPDKDGFSVIRLLPEKP